MLHRILLTSTFFSTQSEVPRWISGFLDWWSRAAATTQAIFRKSLSATARLSADAVQVESWRLGLICEKKRCFRGEIYIEMW